MLHNPHKGLSTLVSSVADPGCLSRMPDPNFFPSRIQGQKDSGSWIRVKEFKYFNPEKISKLSEM
jgi:hypothetical protein